MTIKMGNIMGVGIVVDSNLFDFSLLFFEHIFKICSFAMIMIKLVRKIVLITFTFYSCSLYSESYYKFEGFSASIKIDSFMDIKYKGIVKQKKDYSCGLASLATLINHQYGENYTEDYFINKIKEVKGIKEVELDKNTGYSLLDIKELAEKEGYNVRSIFLDSKSVKDLATPAIVHVNFNKKDISNNYRDGHFSVLSYIDNEKVVLFDPSMGKVIMNTHSFITYWVKPTGTGAVFILHKKNVYTKSKVKIDKNYDKYEKEYRTIEINNFKY